jgi:hypothetical protein
MTTKRSVSSYYFEYLDRVANLEFKNRPAQQGGVEIRYQCARQIQGDVALTSRIVERVLGQEGLGPVILVTGTGNPEWLPQGETDGPSGVAVLARAFAAIGIPSCVLCEERFLPGVRAAVSAAGMPLLAGAAWERRNNGAICLPFPTGATAAQAFAHDLLSQPRGWSAVFFIEKPGPSSEGRFHNGSGVQKDAEWVAHAHVLAAEARRHGLLTVGIGDGGNEIGFGVIREALYARQPERYACRCGCSTGLLDGTDVDILFPVSVSNWGAYAIAAALALRLGREDVMPEWDEVEASIRAPLAHGAFDGYTGMALGSVDGVSLKANRAVYHLFQEVLRLADTEKLESGS